MPFSVEPMVCNDQAEFEHLAELRAAAFTPWYASQSSRPTFGNNLLLHNARALCFPEFMVTLRDKESGRAAAHVFCAAARWDGNPDSLTTYDHHFRWYKLQRRDIVTLTTAYTACVRGLNNESLFQTAVGKLRRRKLAGSNSMVLLAGLVEPTFQGQRLPTEMFGAVREHATALGYAHLIGPFRPSDYGSFKEAEAVAHSVETFEGYCTRVRDDGLPTDRWLRIAQRNGFEFVKAAPESMRITRPLERFETFRKTHKPEQWRQTDQHTWECGETATWTVDPASNTVTSVEPNLWGRISL